MSRPVDIMLDIETLGVRAGCQVLSVGIVAFDRDTFEVIGSRCYKLQTESQAEAGLVADPNTVAWWAKQREEAREASRSGADDPTAALRTLSATMNAWSDKGTRVWSQGNNFDFPILEACFYALEFDDVPWAFWACRDTRTAYGEHGFNPRWVQRKGEHHDAAHDCLHQIECLRQARSYGRKPRWLRWCIRKWKDRK